MNNKRKVREYLSYTEKYLSYVLFIILLQVVFIFWAVYKGFIENEL